MGYDVMSESFYLKMVKIERKFKFKREYCGVRMTVKIQNEA